MHTEFGPFTLDTHKRELTRDGRPLRVQPKVLDTLAYLVTHRERVVGKTELLAEVWHRTEITENVIARAVSGLRRALGDDAKDPRYIKAVAGEGYRFIADARESANVGDLSIVGVVASVPATPGQPAIAKAIALGMVERTVSRLIRLPLMIRHLEPLIESEDDVISLAQRTGIDYVALLQVAMGPASGLEVRLRWLAIETQSVVRSSTFTLGESPVDHTERIPAAIVDAIRDALDLEATAPDDDRALTIDSEAYRHYLLGLVHKNKHVPADTREAITCFEAALDLDPAFALAWAGLAECHDLLATEGIGIDVHYEACIRTSRRALALQHDLPSAINCQARAAWQYEWEWSKADRLFAEAIDLAPNSADLHISRSDFQAFTGQSAAAVASARRAVDLEPLSPWNGTLLAQALYMSGEFAQAIEIASHTIDLNPGFAFAHFMRGTAEYCSGNPERGLADVRMAMSSGRMDFAAASAIFLVKTGRRSEAEALLEGIAAAGDQAPPIAMAVVLTCLGKVDEAIAYLNQVEKMRDWHLLLFVHDPIMQEFGRHPDVQRITQRLNLPA